MPMLVTLSPEECRAAAMTGVDRRLGHLHARTGAVHGDPEDMSLWAIDVEAAGAELAASKALAVPLSRAATPAEDKALGDLVGGIQVRWTRHEHGRLIVHDRDADDHVFVLVTGSMPTYRVAGSITGREAKSVRFWWERCRTPAYFVPQEQLTPVGG